MATEYKKPTSYTEHHAKSSWSTINQAYDTGTYGDETTAAQITDACDEDAYPNVSWHTFGTSDYVYDSATIYVKWDTNDTSGDDTWALVGSYNSGSSWPLVILSQGTNRNTSIQTASVALDIPTFIAAGGLANFRVAINTEKIGGADNDTISIYDIWLEAEYSDRRIFVVT